MVTVDPTATALARDPADQNTDYLLREPATMAHDDNLGFRLGWLGRRKMSPGGNSGDFGSNRAVVYYRLPPQPQRFRSV